MILQRMASPVMVQTMRVGLAQILEMTQGYIAQESLC